ncbi:MAG TPA: hypothetical protein DD979_18190 [Gammaproteobacteria bacterium]|jgi:hypothetical protein|nr:hypothetical protein [Gammaproteobacteria bacterium]
MAFPVIPFLAGAAIGSLLTRAYHKGTLRDDYQRAANTLKAVGNATTDSVKAAASSVSQALKGDEKYTSSSDDTVEESADNETATIDQTTTTETGTDTASEKSSS